MGLVRDKVIGVWPTTGQTFLAKQFTDNGKWFLCQMNATGSSPLAGASLEAFTPRGRQFVSQHGFQKATSVTDEEIAQLEVSPDEQGFQIPATFTVPAQYFQKYTPDGSVFYDKEGNTSIISTTGGGSDIATRSANVLNQAWDYIKANPIMAALAALAIYQFVYVPYAASKGTTAKSRAAKRKALSLI